MTHRKTRLQLAALAVGVVVMALRSAPASSPQVTTRPDQWGLFYDLLDKDRSSAAIAGRTRLLACTPKRVGKDLIVYVHAWNCSNEWIRMPEVTPLSVSLEFRGVDRRTFEPPSLWPLWPGDRPMPKTEDMIELPPGGSVGANFKVRGTYRAKAMNGGFVRAVLDFFHAPKTPDGSFDKTRVERIELRSAWVKVP
jgi:hypothetical protein